MGCSTSPKIVIEVFLDYICPYSKKIVKTLKQNNIISSYSERGVCFTFYQVPQPWHFQTTFCHAVSLSFQQLHPEKFDDFFHLLFEHQEEFFDDVIKNKTKGQILEELGTLAESVGGDKDEVILLSEMDGAAHDGRSIAGELKFVTKFHRKRGVHVTPTVFLNGFFDLFVCPLVTFYSLFDNFVVFGDMSRIEADAISSSWSAEEWREFLDRYVVEDEEDEEKS